MPAVPTSCSTLLLAVLAVGEPSTAPALRDLTGVNIHFTGAPQRDLDLLAEAGFGWVRMDFVWEAVERERGTYRFEPYDALVEGLAKRGIRPLFILDYSNPLYEEARSVRTEEGREAFARFAAAAAGRYRGKGIRWEIWNEPNLEQFWKPQPAAGDYLALAREVSRAVRAADPGAKVVGPAVSGFPWEFLETLFAGGFLSLVDEVTVHPYRKEPPETALADYERLRALIRRHTPAGETPRPVASGEWGYSNWHWGTPFSPELQGAYLARQFLANAAAGIALSVWYDWANDGRDPRNTEHNFGTVTADRKPKPAFLAARTLHRELGRARFEARLAAGEGEHLLLFSEGGGGRRYLALWCEGDPHRVRIRVPGLAEAPRAMGFTGDLLSLEAKGDTVEVPLGPGPCYLELPAGGERPQLAGVS